MRVFNLYLRLLKSYIVVVIIYVSIFLGLALVFFQSGSAGTVGFSNVRIPISFSSEDDSELVESLKSYINNYAYYVDVDEDMIDDAIYFEEVLLAVYIPERFTDEIINGGNPEIKKISNPKKEYALVTVSNAINSYLNLVTLYINNTEMNLTQVLENVEKDLANQVEAELMVENDNLLYDMPYFFNYLSYIITAIMILLIGMIMLKFKNLHLKRRFQSSPYPEHKTNLELTLGHSFLAFSFFILVMIMSYFFYPTLLFSKYGVLFIINVAMFVIVGIALGYFFSLLAKDDNALSAISNIVALGTAFLTGAFVPQFMLGKGILAFAHLFPSYYYIYNNNAIVGITAFNWDSLKGIFLYYVIQLVFAAGLFIAAMLIRKKQLTKEA